MVDAKCADLHVTIQNFSGAMPLNPMLGGSMAPSPNHTPRHSGVARLPRLCQGLNRLPIFVSRSRHCYYISKLKCIKYDFGWSAVSDPSGGAYLQTSPDI